MSQFLRPKRSYPPCPCLTTTKCRGGIILQNRPKGFDTLIFCLNKKSITILDITEDNQIDISLTVERGTEFDASEFGMFDELDLDRYKELDRAKIVAKISVANEKATEKGKAEFRVRLELKEEKKEEEAAKA